eukprot:CAMPEP_0194173354 /NCGR_PEP_ID=MMETSP0154-20130528/7698_1 /TAXON_ID=1049557 /ORGANISM="Thalassiothrix antarctica, Strain L6-D1" /LENGTH=863 /DNA_ID=CAMNT_0038886385 /DNA_START=37 /DNA_END=2624 /DNA_ORIENTATION=+
MSQSGAQSQSGVQSQSQQEIGNSSILSQSDFPNYEEDGKIFAQFLQEHQIEVFANQRTSENDKNDPIPNEDENAIICRVPCYPPLLQRIRDRDYLDPSNPTDFLIEIPLSELISWNPAEGEALVRRSIRNTLRYHQLFCHVLDQALEQMTPSSNQNALARRDTMDILHEQRLSQQVARNTQRENNNTEGGVFNDEVNNQNRNQHQTSEEFPPLLMRRYELRILPLGRKGSMMPFDKQHHKKEEKDSALPSIEGVSLRFVRSRSMGHLVTIHGMIVRASDVKPSCMVATYSCDACGCEVYQVLGGQREFLPQRTCPSEDCRDRPRETLHLQTRGSKFVKYQELKIQELPSQVPMGHVPRSMTVHCKGELTRLTSPGDLVTIDGVFLPHKLADSGYRALKAGLISTTYLDAHQITVHKKSFDESVVSMLSETESKELEAEINRIAHGQDPVGVLSSAIAPEIYGHEDIKRSLLLQLVGGCTRKLPDGMRIRGDINICLMGDPGMAKSQLLKHVASIAPRGVYTTGKGSSGVGLTAAVTRETATNELALEGGALVLADRGICAIDEFDKMDESDRTAIHEVMEQQTVSIAKAGIVATLNARAAVLAAANPLYGRYHKRKSLSENINLPNSLLSRFDLMFLILDVADVDNDMALARHVTLVHQNEGLEKKGPDDNDDENSESNDKSTSSPVTPRILREYIARARRHHPIVPPDVAPYIVEAYVNLRMEHRQRPGDQTAMTPRQLLSILRLSQALARLRFSDFVARQDVDEAIRLTHCSKASLEHHENEMSTKSRKRGRDVNSKVFSILRDYIATMNKSCVEMTLAEAMVLRKGYTIENLQTCLKEYEDLSILQINSSQTHIHFLQGG